MDPGPDLDLDVDLNADSGFHDGSGPRAQDASGSVYLDLDIVMDLNPRACVCFFSVVCVQARITW